MAKKNLKETGVKLNQQLRRRSVNNLIGKLDFMRSNLLNRLSMFIPTKFRWMIPFLESELDLKAPSFDEMLAKLKGEQVEEEISPEIKEASILEKNKTSLYLPQKYRKYNCLLDNPFNCKLTQKSVEEDNTQKYCLRCKFPAILAPERKIQGRLGRYEVQNFLGHRNEGRIYQGIQIPNEDHVIIKEYILPKIDNFNGQGIGYFNDKEINQRKDLFEQLAGLKLFDGREIQDFRLITPFEAISDGREERCYIIIKQKSEQSPDYEKLYTAPTLASYLDETGALNNYEVFSVLNQVLQSLEFLHNQKFKYPNDAPIIGVAHGNITLESLLITFTFQGFFIYLSDLAVWENRFELIDTQRPKPSFTQDLQDLGKVAFYLLAGKQVNPQNYELLDPEDEKNWNQNVDIDLKKYIFNLMGLGIKSYQNATEARQALLKLSLASESLPEVDFSEVEEEKPKEKKKFSRIWLWLIGILGVFLLGFLIWFWGFRDRKKVEIPSRTLICCIAEIAGIPQGIFRFTAEENGLWKYVYTQPNLIVKDKSFEQEIASKQPELKLAYIPEKSSTEMFKKVKNLEVNFAITSNLKNLEDEYESIIFAHDALVMYIPFTYAKRKDSLPTALNGKISLKQIRELYTGKITNWSQLGGPDLPIKLYLPPNEEAILLFEQKVLKEDIYIREFREFRKLDRTDSITNNLPEIVTGKNSFQNLRNTIKDFEEKGIGSIGFDSLSKVFGQCSVYPLAIVEDRFNTFYPLLQSNNNKPISPETDICQKGSYMPNVKDFITQTYPLAYPLGVVYLKDNRQPPIGEKFADILTTKESQEMLFKTGLVPIQPLE